MTDYTPNRIVLEKQFEFDGDENALKFYVEHTICVEFVVTPSKMTVNRLCKKTTIVYKDDDGRSLGFAEYQANITRRMLNKYIFGV